MKQNKLIHNMTKYKFELYDFRSIAILIIKYQIKIEQMVNTQIQISWTLTSKITSAQHKEA